MYDTITFFTIPARRTGIKVFIVWALVLTSLSVNSQRQPVKDVITVDADFPGGNIVLDSVRHDTVFVHHDLTDTQGNWFYWHFRVKGVREGRTLFFQFTHPWEGLKKTTSVIGVHGPGVSLDKGKSWAWLGEESVSGDSFRYRFTPGDSVVHFSMGMPYTEANLLDFLSHYKDNIHLESNVLAVTREGRLVERLHLGRINGSPKHRIVITSRLHASEMMTSYLIEGIIEETLGGGEAGTWLCQNAEILIIPFVDKDGVEKGEQGKNRRGRDHNKDYSGESIYPESQAIRAFVPVWGKNNLEALIDLHCPYIRGKGGHEHIFMIEPDTTAMKSEFRASELRKFAAVLESSAERETSLHLPYRAANNVKFGQGFNRPERWGKDYSNVSIERWALDIPRVRFATTIEFPYANVLAYPYAESGTMVTQQNARAFGRTIAKALYEYLDDLDRADTD